MATSTQDSATHTTQSEWTYPTRMCRICREEVPPTVTFYPSGVPSRFQRVMIEYKNDDEYGRLIKPCLCKGSSRYIHELCLRGARTQTEREESFFKCHTCGYKFNFQKLKVEQFLASKYASSFLTIWVMIAIIFILGFVADPIINLYVDPYDSLLGEREIWNEVTVHAPNDSGVSAWAQHFWKGLVSMGLVGFMKTLLLNPFQWWNIRASGMFGSSRTTTTTGRDRAVNISWIAVVIGVTSAFYFFYKWVRTIIQKTLQRIGNNIVDTQLPDDDDDLKPPAGWSAQSTYGPQPGDASTGSVGSEFPNSPQSEEHSSFDILSQSDILGSATSRTGTSHYSDAPSDTATTLAGVGAFPSQSEYNGAHSTALDSANSQGWSFRGI